MDMRLRTFIHCYFKRPPVLLRHVFALQRCGSALLHDSRFLEVLDVLRQSFHLVDRRRLGRNPLGYSRRVYRCRNRAIHTSARRNMHLLRWRLRNLCRRLLP